MLIIAMLAALVVVGIGLLVLGAFAGNWHAVTGGGIAAFLVRWPLTRLIALHRQNLALATIPLLVQMANVTEARRLIAQLIRELIRGTR